MRPLLGSSPAALDRKSAKCFSWAKKYPPTTDGKRNDTERVWEVTMSTAPGTHCLSGHPDIELALDLCFLHKLNQIKG